MENLVSVKIGQVIYQKSEATEGYKPYVVELVANNGLFLRDFDTIYLEDDIGRRFVENHEISEYFSDKVGEVITIIMPEEYEQPGKFALLSERMGNPHASESAWKTGNSPEYVRLVYNLLFSIEKPIDFVHSIPSSEAMSYFDWVKERGSTIPVFYGPDLKIDTSDDYKMSGYSIKDSPNGIGKLFPMDICDMVESFFSQGKVFTFGQA